MNQIINKIINEVENRLYNKEENIENTLEKIQEKYEAKTNLFKMLKLVRNSGIYIDDKCIIEFDKEEEYHEQIEKYEEEFSTIEQLTEDFFRELCEENMYYCFNDSREVSFATNTKEFYVSFILNPKVEVNKEFKDIIEKELNVSKEYNIMDEEEKEEFNERLEEKIKDIFDVEVKLYTLKTVTTDENGMTVYKYFET